MTPVTGKYLTDNKRKNKTIRHKTEKNKNKKEKKEKKKKKKPETWKKRKKTLKWDTFKIIIKYTLIKKKSHFSHLNHLISKGLV